MITKKKFEVLRLSKTEQAKTLKKKMEINKMLAACNKEEVSSSELLHYLIEIGLKTIEVNQDGEIYFNNK